MPRAAPVTMAVSCGVVLAGCLLRRRVVKRVGRKDLSAEGRASGLDERGDDPADPLEAGPDGLAVRMAVVDALTDHGELEVAERGVPGQGSDIEAGPRGIPLDELLHGREAVVG